MIRISFSKLTAFALVAGSALAASYPCQAKISPQSFSDVIAIAAGSSSTVGTYLADTDYSGGALYHNVISVDTTHVSNPAPLAVYQYQRYGNMTYTIPGLTAGATYMVRLHFAELFWSSVGSRVFNVSINGNQLLTNFDIIATAGAAATADVEQFSVAADSSGNITIHFTNVTDNAVINGIEVESAGGTSPTGPDVVAISAGTSSAIGSYAADTDYSGGFLYNNPISVDTSHVSSPAPLGVYQHQRYGNMTYTIPGLTASQAYTVRLHFAELFFSSAGSRLFNVSINGTQVLSNFDILATAGGAAIAEVEQFTTNADSSGNITIQFTNVVNNAVINGIEVEGTGYYSGLVSTRGIVASQNNSSYLYANSRSFHYSRVAFSQVQIALPCWKVNGGGGEAATGGPVTYQASFEYPAGTIYPFTFSSASSGACTAGTSVYTDVLTLPVTVPANTLHYIRVFADASAATSTGIVYGYPSQAYAAGGDGIEVSSTSISSKTTGGTISFTAGFAPIFPLMVMGQTNQPSVFLLGDSRTVGISDAADSAGDTGETARSVGAHFAYTNAGCSGEQGWAFANYFGTTPTANTQRMLLAPNFSHVVSEYGVNDIGSGQTYATIQGTLEQIWGLFPGKKVFQTTIMGETNSTDSWATLANQSPATNFSFSSTSMRPNVNNWIRGLPSGVNLTGYFEVAGALEPVQDDGLWPVNGTANYYTGDGVHEKPAAALLIQSTIGAAVQSAIHF